MNEITSGALDRLVVVLYEPQNDINIGNVVRAAKNLTIRNIRLVRPASADHSVIAISAPKADDVLREMKRFSTLDEAIADCTCVIGLTARARKGAWVVAGPEAGAADALRHMEDGPVALLFGREDHGLPNHALDRCDTVVTIPTDPEYSSLNLGQAVLLMCWEVVRSRRALQGVAVQLDPEDRSANTEFEPVTRGQLERLFERIDETLREVGFYKSQNDEHVLRSVRSVFLRSHLDRRELSIWLGIFKEIPAFVKRRLLERDGSDHNSN
jgi:TrmH family RNA methyltransferase